MQWAEIDREQQLFKIQVRELKGGIAKLAAQRQALEQKHLSHSMLLQKLGRYLWFGVAGKLRWVSFRLKLKQAKLARMVIHPDERMNGVAALLRMVPPASTPTASDTILQKMEQTTRVSSGIPADAKKASC